jgi:hypothetical protein
MKGRPRRGSALVVKRVILIGLALCVSLLAWVAAPMVGATPGRSAALQRGAAGTPTISNPIATAPPNIATPNVPTPTPGGPPTATPQPTIGATATTATTPTTAPTPGTTPGATPTPTPPTNTTASASAALAHVPVGTMDITYTPRTRVARTTLNMTGMSQGGAAVAVVLNGSCATPGGVAWRGAPFTADANGKLVNFVVNYANVSGIPTEHVVGIETVQSTNEVRVDALLACGPIASTLTAGRNRGSVILGPVPGVTNGAVSGSATLTQSNGSLTIALKALGLYPGAAYATSLHLGSCQWLSYVLYDLPEMSADASGNGAVTITINNAEPLSASNDWYIAIDYSATLNRSYFMPISCGNVAVIAPS